MNESHARLKRGRLRDQSEVHDFLNRVREEHAPAGRARGHYVAVITEDRQPVRRDRARGDVKDRAGLLAGNLEHVGNHQQQALARREGGRQGAGL